MSDSAILKSGLGPIENPVTVDSNVIGTTAAKPVVVAPATTDRTRIIKAEITNPNASASLGWQLVERGQPAPAITVNFAGVPGTAAAIILPGASKVISFTSNFELVLVASAAASNYNVASSLYG